MRESLGLIDDELLAELLDIVADHRTGEVFPYVARLVESGADLVEFVIGVGDVLRGLLLRITGGEPDGLTEHLREAIDRHADGYEPGDVVRMLKLLAEAEGVVRRSPNARMHVETLLLEWTLLDRTIELAEVLRALDGGGTEPRTPAPPRRTRAAVRPEPAGETPQEEAAPAQSPAAPSAGNLSLDVVKDRWPRFLDAVAEKRRMLREALAHASPTALQDGELVLDVSDSEVHLEGLERGREAIQEVAHAFFGQPLRVAYAPAAGAANDAPAPPQATQQRLDRDLDRKERLRAYRQKDAALDAVADALDLELLE